MSCVIAVKSRKDRQLRVKTRRDRNCTFNCDPQCIAVGRGLGDDLEANIAAGAIVDDDGLPERTGQVRRKHARGGIRCASVARAW